MIDFPTTPTGGVRSVRRLATNNTPTTTRLGGVGVRCGYEKFDIADRGKSGHARRLLVKIQAGCRPMIGSAS
jgi:hypothetical protein